MTNNVTIEQSPDYLIFNFPLSFIDLTGQGRKNQNLFTFIGIIQEEILGAKYHVLSIERISVYLPRSGVVTPDFLLWYYSRIEGEDFTINPLNFDLEIESIYHKNSLTLPRKIIKVKEGYLLPFSDLVTRS